MCGIAGVVGVRGGGRADEAELVALRDAQAHRGPDDAGLWRSPDTRVGLAHRRLSIIDLSAAGHQPMASADGRRHIVFNGEIYNFRALREELEATGRVFHTQSDTEVLLQGYDAWGEGLLDRVRGMFALAIHDEASGETFLARDPLGIKPLYWADDGRRVLFASEVQALRAALDDDGGLDPEALSLCLAWGSIPAPRTLYRRIRALPAGSWMRLREGAIEGPRVYWRLQDAFGRDAPMSEADAAEHIREALRDTAAAHLVADVPVGAFLSGGVDSSALVGLLSEQRAHLRTVNLSFDVPGLDEGPLARQAAELYGADHRDVPIRAEEIRERMPDAIRALDQPSIDGVNSYFVSEAAVAAGLKVAVSGVGGDELFGGYATFERVPRIQSIHAALHRVPGAGALASPIAALCERLPGGRLATRIATGLRYGADASGAYYAERGLFRPHEIRALCAPELAEALIDPVDELRERLGADGLPEAERVSGLELGHYLLAQLLRDTDAVSMRHALEVRTPLVDRVLLERVCAVPPSLRRAGPAKKHLRLAPAPPVPDALWDRRKQGFTLPFDHWLKSGGIPLRLPRHEWLRQDALADLEQQYRAGRVHWSRAWMLHVLATFLD